ncbi:MAG TPA: MFS transporter, partial [Microbacterium sp.]|nr:MFS transporter [Microbacterium sp.]
ALTIMLLVGVVLDAAAGGGGLYTLDAFRVAFLVPFGVAGVGVVLLLHARGRTRRRMFVEEGIAVTPLRVALIEAWRRRGGGRDQRPS